MPKMVLERTLFKVEVAESEKGREYWASRPWLTSGNEARAADILIVPWENLREKKPALFPQGTGEFYRALLLALTAQRLAIAIDKANYEEVALHTDELRLPTCLVTLVVLPFFINLLATNVDRWLSHPAPANIVEMEVIVEGEQGRCISIKYKGPPSEMVETISKHVENCRSRLGPHGKSKHKPRK
jgi:hypothetical protein